VLFQTQSILGLLLLLVGIGLIILEMLMPGFGLPGIAGSAAIIIGILLYAKSLSQALFLLALVAAVLAMLFLVVLRSVSKGRLSRSPIVLRDAARDTAGYDGFLNPQELVGKCGTALSMLRPSGIGVFDGQRLDVVSDGAFLPSGTVIRIVRLEGRKILVQPVPEPSQPLKGA